MTDEVDWESASWEGNRRRQHREFMALPLREKLLVIEQLSEVAAFFSERRRARGLPVHPSLPGHADRERGETSL